MCQAGTCVEQTIGASQFAYCHCNPGWTGQTCNQCMYPMISSLGCSFAFHALHLGYFTCQQAGVFPDTAYCSIGRYFYCPTVGGGKRICNCLFEILYAMFYLSAPVSAMCPDGQKFDRVSNSCSTTATC